MFTIFIGSFRLDFGTDGFRTIASISGNGTQAGFNGTAQVPFLKITVEPPSTQFAPSHSHPDLTRNSSRKNSFR
jgi:hypothetical protein